MQIKRATVFLRLSVQRFGHIIVFIKMKHQFGIRLLLDDRDAQGRLYSRHHERLLAIARHYIGDDDAARDVEHDAWVMILSSLDTLRDESKLEAWMGSIVRNMALNYLKQNNHIKQIPMESVNEAVVPCADEEANVMPVVPMNEIIAMVRRLPQGYEQVFRLNTFEGMSHEQIGRLLGITSGSSRSQLSRARKMLQQMMRQRWALLPLVLVFVLLLVVYRMKNRPGSVPDIALQPFEAKPEAPTQVEPNMPTTAKPIHTMPQTQNVEPAIQPHTLQYTVIETPADTAHTEEPAMPHSMSADMGTVDLARHEGLQVIEPPCPDLPNINPVATAIPAQHDSRNKWSMHLAYGGAPAGQSTIVDNFLSVINFAAGETTRTTRLFTWGDYYKYVDANGALMDSVDALRMNAIALRHLKENPLEELDDDEPEDNTPLSETKHHYRPRDYGLSFSYPLTSRWNLNSGLHYTYMKSVFESDNGNENDITRRTQRLHYLGIPLGATYNIWQRGRWQVYATGNLRLDVPVYGKETTQFIYIGPYEHAPGDSIVFPSTHATIKAPLQWSVGAGVGVQFRLLPHVNVYFEPKFRYYFPTSTPVETYRTIHRFDVALPLGIRFVP